jgi:hypothetical protein
MHENEKILRNAYQVAEDKDVAGWIALLIQLGRSAAIRTIRKSLASFVGPCGQGSGTRAESSSFRQHEPDHLQFQHVDLRHQRCG